MTPEQSASRDARFALLGDLTLKIGLPKAKEWMIAPCAELGGKTPKDMIQQGKTSDVAAVVAKMKKTA